MRGPRDGHQNGFGVAIVNVMLVLVCAGLLLAAVVGSTDLRNVGEALVGQDVLEVAARRFLKEQDERFSRECTRTITASWNFQTNITAHNMALLVAAQEDFKRLQGESRKMVEQWRGLAPYLWDASSTVRRQLKIMSDLGPTALPAHLLAKYTMIVDHMTAVYTSNTICSYHQPDDCSLTMKEGVKEVVGRSRDPQELLHVWRAWREGTRKTRTSYTRFVKLANLAAQANRYVHKAELELAPYGGGDFKDQMSEAWEQLKPLYQQLHAYVRRKLREVYGPGVVSVRGPLPAHLLGNMWAQVWRIRDLLEPFPGKTYPNVTQEMRKQGYTPRRIFETADNFFASLNLTRAPPSFWQDSLLQEPQDRKVICHGTTWDFCNGKDFRVKQCTQVGEEDLVSAHHELTHLQYFLQYRHLPYHYRQGANPGFHEAVGYALELSVATPRHLHRVGLLGPLQEDPQADINFLLGMALDRLAFMPFAYLMDLWRWRVFDGTYQEKDWNCAWWDLRHTVQGVKPPVVRTEEDFDPAAKYNVAADLPYTRYFVSFVLQFQFHKALCLKAGEYDPLDPTKSLHKCDIYQSTEAGNALGDMMRLGRSRPWPEALEVLTGGRKMDASAMREYFRPLEEWLTEDNARHKEFVGWRADGEYCLYEKPSRPRSCARVLPFLGPLHNNRKSVTSRANV